MAIEGVVAPRIECIPATMAGSTKAVDSRLALSPLYIGRMNVSIARATLFYPGN